MLHLLATLGFVLLGLIALGAIALTITFAIQEG